MRVATGNATLNFDGIAKPVLVNPKISDTTKGRDLIILQEDKKLRWTEYHLQLIIDSVVV